MHSSLRAMLSEIIDYAGLFPPAELELEPAIRNYAGYLSEPDAWMLARFVCPAGRLHELTAFAELFDDQWPLRLSVLGRGGETRAQFLGTLFADIDCIRELRQQADMARVDALETRMPLDVIQRDAKYACDAFLRDVTNALRKAGLRQAAVFFEVPLPTERDATRRAIDAIGAFDLTFGGSIGFKLRCGGLEAKAFPAPEQVARVIEQCRDANVPLKFTAGLHHPLRRYDPSVPAHMHGFLNVFVAGVLADALGLGYHDLLAVLEEQDIRQFVFADDGLRWNDAEATLRDIEHARRRSVLSFGSCSFDEPREDLRRMGLA